MLTDLIRLLPETINQDPQVIPALLVTYDGSACWVEIADDTLRTAVSGGSGADLLIDLRSLNLQALILQIAAQPGYGAGIIQSFTDAYEAAGLPLSTFGAWCLADVTQDVVANPNLGISTSALFQVLRPVAATLRDRLDEINAIANNVEIDRTAGLWLSDYGDLYGVDRNPSETDADYRTRLVAELIEPRTNNLAIRQIVRQLWGLADVSVVDDMTPASDQDGLLQQQGLPWRRLNPYHFLLTLQLSERGGLDIDFTSLKDLVTRIKAWGTTFDEAVLGVNQDTASLPGDAATWDDVLTEIDNVILFYQDPYTTGVSDIWTDTPRASLYQFLHTLKLADGHNADNVILPLSGTPRFLILGHTQSMVNYVESIVEEWADSTALTSETMDQYFAGTDAFLGDTYLNDEAVTAATDGQGADALASIEDEVYVSRAWTFKTNTIASRTQSRFALIYGGRLTYTDALPPIYDFYQDYRNGVPMQP